MHKTSNIKHDFVSNSSANRSLEPQDYYFQQKQQKLSGKNYYCQYQLGNRSDDQESDSLSLDEISTLIGNDFQELSCATYNQNYDSNNNNNYLISNLRHQQHPRYSSPQTDSIDMSSPNTTKPNQFIENGRQDPPNNYKKSYQNGQEQTFYQQPTQQHHQQQQQSEFEANNTNDELGQQANISNQMGLQDADAFDICQAAIGYQQAKPYVEIVEQPARCALRFRYKCEGRSAGSLPGVGSTADNKTFPSIKIHNYIGRAVVVVSCVTKDAPYLAHPHNIVGKEGCKKGICTVVVQNELDTVRSFASLGIQCVKRKEIAESLNVRESIRVDPFRNGFGHREAANLDLNVVRLCFQVFIEGSTPNKCDISLTPVVSDPIHDKKAMSDLVITKLSHCSAPATGGREMILLCDRIAKDDITIRFYEETQDGQTSWENFVELAPTDIHKQVAMSFKTPQYYNINITKPVDVYVQLKRISDGQVSEPRRFQMLPCESDEDALMRKRQKIGRYALDNMFAVQPHASHQQQPQQQLLQPQLSQIVHRQQPQQHHVQLQPQPQIQLQHQAPHQQMRHIQQQQSSQEQQRSHHRTG